MHIQRMASGDDVGVRDDQSVGVPDRPRARAASAIRDLYESRLRIFGQRGHLLVDLLKKLDQADLPLFALAYGNLDFLHLPTPHDPTRAGPANTVTAEQAHQVVHV